MLFDSHAHLDDRAFDLDRSELIRTLPERGIGLLMDPGCSLAASYAAAALAEETPWIYAAAGSHPRQPEGEGRRRNWPGLSL